MLELATGDYRLALAPERGGSVLRCDWRGEPLLRAACGPSPFDVACFPLVPFSNRIAYGRFSAGGQAVSLSPNFPGAFHPHPLHGFGWLAAWRVMDAEPHRCVMEHGHSGGEWPWPYLARQSVLINEGGVTLGLELENLGDTPMPAGLGFHPYFPDQRARYLGFHKGEWQNAPDGLPLAIERHEAARDWWGGMAVGDRTIDTVYTERAGPLTIRWPGRGIAVRLEPSARLSFTVVYTPAGADHFCIEPVSHMTDAVNRPAADSGFVMLAPGETMTASLRLVATLIRKGIAR